MQIELTGHDCEIVEKLVADGDFASPDEAVAFALSIFGNDRPTVESLRVAVQEGLDDVAAGRVSTYASDDELKAFFEDVKRRGRARLSGNADS